MSMILLLASLHSNDNRLQHWTSVTHSNSAQRGIKITAEYMIMTILSYYVVQQNQGTMNYNMINMIVNVITNRAKDCNI